MQNRKRIWKRKKRLLLSASRKKHRTRRSEKKKPRRRQQGRKRELLIFSTTRKRQKSSGKWSRQKSERILLIIINDGNDFVRKRWRTDRHCSQTPCQSLLTPPHSPFHYPPVASKACVVSFLAARTTVSSRLHSVHAAGI